MPEFPKPEFTVRIDAALETQKLRLHGEKRGVPSKQDDRLLLATWNVANFEVQEREAVHLDLIAEMVSWCDVVALQEIRDDLTGLRALRERLPGEWALWFSEASGNDERQAFAFDTRKARVGEKVGKLTIPPARLKHAGGRASAALTARRTWRASTPDPGRCCSPTSTPSSAEPTRTTSSTAPPRRARSPGGATSARTTHTPTRATSSLS